jgi:hypothetical protein
MKETTQEKAHYEILPDNFSNSYYKKKNDNNFHQDVRKENGGILLVVVNIAMDIMEMAWSILNILK